MPLSSIVTVVLRTFSLLWFVQGLTMFVSASSMMQDSSSLHVNYWNYAASALLLLMAAVAFFLSGPLAGILTPPANSTVNLGGLSQYDLYCFAFTFLGLYFALSSLASSLNWVHFYFFLSRSVPEHDQQRQTSFYQLTQSLVTLAAGGASLLFAPQCARKLAQVQRRAEPSERP